MLFFLGGRGVIYRWDYHRAVMDTVPVRWKDKSYAFFQSHDTVVGALLGIIVEMERIVAIGLPYRGNRTTDVL